MSQWSLTLISSNINLGSFSVLLLRELPWDKEKGWGGGGRNKEIGSESSEQRGRKANEKWNPLAFKNCTAGLLNFIQQRCYKDKEFLKHHHSLDRILSCPTLSFRANNKKGCFLSALSLLLHLTPPPRHHYRKRASNKRQVWTAGMQVWL